MHNQKMERLMSYYARVLIIVSIALLSYGIVLQLNTSPKLEKEIPKIVDNSSISVTTIEEELEKNPLYTEHRNIEIDNTTQLHKQKEDNNKLRIELQNTYGILIYYGKETEGYKVSNKEYKIKSFPITDENIISEQLNKLKVVLSNYPIKLFKEIKKGGIPLSIYLINNYEDKTITGITDSTYDYANISIAAVYPLEESFYHESYHYIERYLYKKGANFKSWNSLNPSNFKYGKIYNDLSYSHTFSKDAYFVNNYAQTSSEEDRASTFEYMMATTKASCLNKNTTIWNKARLMSLTIETVLNSVEPNNIEYWERHL